jgi:LmbE family N-acetylglucosaminyl deacetylase
VLTVLHLAPHPDDEVLGAGATLLGLREAGHRVINLACSRGRPDQH